jgi:alpha-tubulin suppressor-like RCC1 family protein
MHTIWRGNWAHTMNWKKAYWSHPRAFVAVTVVILGSVLALSSARVTRAPAARLRAADAGGPAAGPGAVYGWMDDDTGQIGIGTVIPQYHFPIPVQTYMPAGVTSIAVAAGQSHSLILTSTGSVYAVGLNGRGQLGDGKTTSTTMPVKASLPAGVTVTAVAAGWDDSLALTSTGSVYAWGYNVDGELGNGTLAQSDVPVLVNLPAGLDVVAIAAGQYHSLAVASSGAVYSWGNNVDGQLGNGTTTNSELPVLVDLPDDVVATAVGAGDNHSVIATSTGAVYDWGKNVYGQLGNGTTTQSDTPVPAQVPTGVSIVSVVAGGISPTATSPEGDYTLALTSTGAIYAWGSGATGELGNGTKNSSLVPTPTSLPAGVTATVIGAGPGYAHALSSNGDIYQWGGPGSLNPTPTPLPNGLRATATSTGPDGEQILAIFQ